MKKFKLFLILLGTFFAAPALADEIGSGQPETTQSTASQPAPSEADSACDWLLEEILGWFE